MKKLILILMPICFCLLATPICQANSVKNNNNIVNLQKRINDKIINLKTQMNNRMNKIDSLTNKNIFKMNNNEFQEYLKELSSL